MPTRRRFLAASGAAALLAACARPEEQTAPAPATRFEPGGGPIREVRMEPGQQDLVGVWQGPYAPINMASLELTGTPAGRATLNIGEIDGSRARGLMGWDDEDQEFEPQRIVGALTITGHFMILHAHFIMYRQDDVRFLEADIAMPDGRFYRHRLVQTAG
ncbi:MAG: twin-arginine translocation signal domain-containing protein [Pseudomonadota bacterium]